MRALDRLVAARETTRRYGHAITWTLLIRSAGTPLQLAFFMLAARTLHMEDFGRFAMANACWQFSKGCGPLGLDQAMLRFLPALVSEGRLSEAAALESWARRRVIAVTSTLAICGIAVLFLASMFWESSALLRWLGPVAIGLPAFSLMGLQTAQLRARGRVLWAQVPDSLVFYALALLVAVVLLGGGVSAWRSWLAATIVSSFATGAIQLFRLAHRAPNARIEESLLLAVSRVARGALVGQTATAVSGRFPTLLAGPLLGSAGAGLVDAALRLGQVGSIVTWASGVSVSPLFSEAYSKRDVPRLRSLLAWSTLAASVPAVAIVVAAMAWGDRLLALFGSGFAQAHLPLILFALAALINAVWGPCGTLLYMSGHERVVATQSVLGGLVLLLAGALLGSYWGAAGIGAAACLAAAIRDGGMAWALRRCVGFAPPFWISQDRQAAVSVPKMEETTVPRAPRGPGRQTDV